MAKPDGGSRKVSETVLVTGGAGYIGSQCCKLLAANGFRPVTYDNMSSGRPDFVRYGPMVEGDILDGVRLDSALQEYRPKTVVHFAALIEVEESTREPTLYYDVNACGTLALIEKCKEHGVEQLIFSSTAAVYGEPPASPVTLETPTQPINPYGWSKLMSERFLSDCAADAEIGVTIFRYFNACGSDPDTELGMRFEGASHLLPRLITAAAEGTQFSIFGTDYDTADGSCVRDYIHVWDVANAHIAAMQSPVEQGKVRTFNIGVGRGFSVKEVIDSVERVTGSKIDVQVEGRRAGDASELVAGDIENAKDELGWRAKFVEIDEIVGHGWDWYCAYN
ncbi:MAG: UDP-glucose 4-epimerase GalE [Rhodospirillaceae bacterium]|nr:UDP-glucose 4-epimerase GalE [Rhodospirillaceae bacterium]